MHRPQHTELIDADTLRILVGMQGMLLPILLPLLCRFLGDAPALRDTISDYYASAGRDLFVGFLFTIGGGLLAYRGRDGWDRWAGNAAFVCALGVALFPTTDPATHRWHLLFAATLFLILALFALILFRRDDTHPEWWKIRWTERDGIFALSGAIILLCILKIALLALHPAHPLVFGLPYVWLLETLALEAFGISWFVKGNGHQAAIAVGRRVYRRARGLPAEE